MTRLLLAALLGAWLTAPFIWGLAYALVCRRRLTRVREKRLMRHWHRLKAQSARRHAMLIVPLLMDRSDWLTIGRERRN